MNETLWFSRRWTYFFFFILFFRLKIKMIIWWYVFILELYTEQRMKTMWHSAGNNYNWGFSNAAPGTKRGGGEIKKKKGIKKKRKRKRVKFTAALARRRIFPAARVYSPHTLEQLFMYIYTKIKSFFCSFIYSLRVRIYKMRGPCIYTRLWFLPRNKINE